MSRILVISDDRAFAFSLRVLLMRDGHSVMVAEDASAGLFRLFMDEPGFVVVNLHLEGEVFKVCRQLYENAGVPFLVIGSPVLMDNPELGACLPSGSFQPLPAPVRRVWGRINSLLRKHSGPAATESGKGPSTGGPGINARRRDGPGHANMRGRSDYRYRTYEKYSRMDPRPGPGPSLQIWV